MKNSAPKFGNIRLPADESIWQHELVAVQALAREGYDVEFIATRSGNHRKSPDIKMGGIYWEIKSPRADKLSAIERNIKRALKQSPNIIIDSQRMKKIHDTTIEKYLIQKFHQQKAIQKMIFINRKHTVIVIR